jgi:alpha-galactosidase
MVFSMCEWGVNKPWLWAKDVGHSWRTTGDIELCFNCKVGHDPWFNLGVMNIIDKQEGLRNYAGPGHWNDPDMLQVGNGMSVNEDRVHFSMWCMLAAPLISGNDLRSMSKETNDILTNKEVIAVDQDSLGVEGFKYSAKDSVEIWFKPLVNDDWAMCILNRSLNTQSVFFDWKKEVVFDRLSKRDAAFDKTVYLLRNLWTKEDAGTTKEELKAEVPGHDVLMLRLSKKY